MCRVRVPPGRVDRSQAGPIAETHQRRGPSSVDQRPCRRTPSSPVGAWRPKGPLAVARPWDHPGEALARPPGSERAGRHQRRTPLCRPQQLTRSSNRPAGPGPGQTSHDHATGHAHQPPGTTDLRLARRHGALPRGGHPCHSRGQQATGSAPLGLQLAARGQCHMDHTNCGARGRPCLRTSRLSKPSHTPGIGLSWVQRPRTASRAGASPPRGTAAAGPGLAAGAWQVRHRGQAQGCTCAAAGRRGTAQGSIPGRTGGRSIDRPGSPPGSRAGSWIARGQSDRRCRGRGR